MPASIDSHEDDLGEVDEWDGEEGAASQDEPNDETPRSAPRGFVRTATWRQGRVPYLLQDVIEARFKVDAAERQLTKRVRSAREHGASWEDIGTALGMSRQGAAKRFGTPAR